MAPMIPGQAAHRPQRAGISPCGGYPVPPSGLRGGRALRPGSPGRRWSLNPPAFRSRPTRRGADVPEVAAVADVILLQGIQVPAALGVTAAERRMRRPVTIDLELETPLLEAGRSDRIGRTIHYRRVFEVVEDVASHQEHRLVEALGHRIAAAVLGKFGVDAVTVTVRKPSPIAGVLTHAGIRIHRKRGEL